MNRSVRTTIAVSAAAAGMALVVALGQPSGPRVPRGGPDVPGAGGTAGQGGAASSSGQAGLVRTTASDLHHDLSRPLRSIVPLPPAEGAEDPDLEAPHPLPGRTGNTAPGAPDPVVQSSPVAVSAPSLLTDWEGVSNVNGVLPPDTNGDVGPNHYVQWVNLSFAIYTKAGTLLYGPANGNTLWTGFGGPCESTNSGDPIVQYDHLADRWMMSQFALPNYPSGPFYQCIAVSQTGDPTGAWYRYAFQISATKLNDYPHFGVWPDGYYMSINQFSSNSWAGAGAVAFERAKMLLGQPAQMVYFDLYGVDPNLGGMLPSDLDGPAPAAGTPNLFVQADDDGNGYPQDQLELWAFHVDWTDTARSSFTGPTILATAPFDSNMCNYSRSCIPEPDNPPKALDALSDRLMYRVQFRDFGDHRSIVLNQTVDTNGSDRAGIRWWELRSTTGTWSIFQQGTWSPDATNRWAGSVAMDGSGDIALGYSVGSSTVYPGIRFTGRLAGDPLGQMTQGEGSIVEGTGRQTHSASRWGDYSMLAIDPVDDCTFWYTNEYIATSGTAPWQTRIASFKLPGCGGGDGTPPSVSSFTGPSSPTNASTLAYHLSFSESVTGLTAGDLSRTGTATGCVIGTPTGSGASWAVDVTGCSEGTITLTLAAGSVVDLASNAGPTADVSAAAVTIDRTAPTASVSCSTSSPTNATSISCSATFSEAVAGGSSFTSGDVSRTGTSTTWTVGSPTGSGAGPYAFAVTQSNPKADGSVSLQVVAGAVTDAAGNPSSASGTVVTTIDQTSPGLTSFTGPTTPTNAVTLSYDLVFSESVSGLTAGDFTRTGTATGCTVNAPTGSGSAYTVTVTGCSDGTVTLTLQSAAVTDAVGNAGPASSQAAATVTIDRTGPTATLSCTPASPTNAASLSCSVTFSEAVGGGSSFTSGDVSRTGSSTTWTVGSPTGSGAGPYTFSVSQGAPTADGSVSLQVVAGAVTDALGNASTASSTVLRTIDQTAPASTASITATTTSGTSVPVDYVASDAGAGVVSVAAYVSTAPGLTSPTQCGSVTSGAASGTITCTIPAIDATYYVYTRATDAAGNVEAAPGVADDAIVRSSAGVPGAPTAASATAGNASAGVTWSAPASDGGAAITGYTVTSSPGAKTCTTGGTIGCTVTGLTNGVAYTFTVTATNGSGTGPASQPSNSVTPYGPGLVVRYAGANRFATAAAISAATFAPGVDVAYIAYAYNFPDALAGAAAAGTIKGPILYAATTGTLDASTAAELTRLQPKRIVVLGGTGVISDGVKTALGAYTSGTVTRLAGADRFATAAAISAATFSPGVAVAYISYAYNFPDALAGAAAAGTLQGPILYAATTGTLAASTASELERLGPARIVVLGGTGVISDAVMTQLSAYSATVVRYAGANRFATAAAISAATFAPGVDVAYIAYAYNFPDALAGAAAAGTIKGPILYAATTGTLDASTATELTRLKPKIIVVLGGTGVISDAVMTQLGTYAVGP